MKKMEENIQKIRPEQQFMGMIRGCWFQHHPLYSFCSLHKKLRLGGCRDFLQVVWPNIWAKFLEEELFDNHQ